MSEFQPITLTPDEQKTRRQWLILTICLFVFPVSTIFSLIYQFVFVEAGSFDPFYVIPFLIVTATVSFVPFWLLWHFCYKKKGTAFLRSSIAISLLLRVNIAARILQEHWVAWELSLYLLEWAVYIGWFIFSLKLLRINGVFCLQKRILRKSC